MACRNVFVETTWESHGLCEEQVKGKGYWGEWEGIEKVMGLSPAAAAWVNRPLNYARVQVRHTSPWLCQIPLLWQPASTPRYGD